MCYGSTVIGATATQRVSWTLWMNWANSHSESQPFAHTVLPQGISALWTKSLLSGVPGSKASTLGSPVQSLLVLCLSPRPLFGTPLMATIDVLPWQRLSLIHPKPRSWFWHDCENAREHSFLCNYNFSIACFSNSPFLWLSDEHIHLFSDCLLSSV